MMMLAISACALSLTANPGLPNESEGAALDQEISVLSGLLAKDGNFDISGRLGARYGSNSDIDIGGFSALDARLAVDGTHGDYGYRVEVDFAGEEFLSAVGGGLVVDNLLDAYATFGIGDNVTAQIGRFRADVCDDANLDEGNMDHVRHSMIGGWFSRRSGGFGLSGAMDSLNWSLSIMNGSDDIMDELLTAVRVSMAPVEGLSLSAAVVDDGAFDDLGATVVTVGYETGALGLGIEYADVADMFATSDWAVRDAATFDIGPPGAGGTSPMVISATYDVNEDWRLAVRMTDADYAIDSDSTEITANYGNWQIGMVDGQIFGVDFSAWTVGMSVDF